MSEKTLTREQCINIYKAQAQTQAAELKEWWANLFRFLGWPVPSELR